MSETPKGTDLPNPTIEVAGMRFSTYIGVGAAQWLEAELHCGIVKALEEFQNMGDDAKDLSITKVSKIVVALYLQANLDEDPAIAQRKIRALSLEQMMEIINR